MMRREEAPQAAVWKEILAGLVVCCVCTGPIKADVYQYLVPTVEWLVDKSDFIAVVRESKDNKPPNVLRTLKGSQRTIQWPLRKVELGQQVYLPPDDGRVRLIFVRGTSELLCAVELGRGRPKHQVLRETYYGTTEYGQLLMTESQLYDAIDARLKSEASPAIALKPSAPHRYLDHRGFDAVIAPAEFPLEAEDLTYVLIVSFTAARRDHYIRMLRTGDAAERMHAIKELSILADPLAEQAIREAVTCANVTPTFEFSWKNRAPVAITSKDIRQFAERVLTRD